MTRDQILSAAARDLEVCEVALALFRLPAMRRPYLAQRRACKAAIAELAPVDPVIGAMSDDDLLRELGA